MLEYKSNLATTLAAGQNDEHARDTRKIPLFLECTMTSDLGFGDYIVASDSFFDSETALRWDKGEIALVFSRRKRTPPNADTTQHYDLLFENGRTAFTVSSELIHRFFRVVHRDPDVIIDGCSTNVGWKMAHQNIKNE